jgi:hypothetical protein
MRKATVNDYVVVAGAKRPLDMVATVEHINASHIARGDNRPSPYCVRTLGGKTKWVRAEDILIIPEDCLCKMLSGDFSLNKLKSTVQKAMKNGLLVKVEDPEPEKAIFVPGINQGFPCRVVSLKEETQMTTLSPAELNEIFREVDDAVIIDRGNASVATDAGKPDDLPPWEDLPTPPAPAEEPEKVPVKKGKAKFISLGELSVLLFKTEDMPFFRVAEVAIVKKGVRRVFRAEVNKSGNNIRVAVRMLLNAEEMQCLKSDIVHLVESGKIYKVSGSSKGNWAKIESAVLGRV